MDNSKYKEKRTVKISVLPICIHKHFIPEAQIATL